MRRLLLFFVFIIAISCKSDDIQPSAIGSLEPKSTGEIIKHTYYTLSYSEVNEQAYWVYYQLTPELINGTQSRTDDFRLIPLYRQVLHHWMIINIPAMTEDTFARLLIWH
jgi:hypothetical protein